MAKDYLLLFLEKRIFTLKTGDDQLLQKLRGAVEALVGKIKADRTLVIPYTLVALDSNTPIGDPVFETVAAVVQDQWNTYTEIFLEPRTVFRAVLLDALLSTAEEDVEAAGAIDLISRNVLPHLQSGGEAEIIAKFRDQIREIAQAEAESQWPSNIQIVPPKLSSIKLGQLSGKSVTIDRTAFRNGFTQPSWQNNWQTDSRMAHQAIATTGADHIATTIERAVADGDISSDELKKHLTDPLLKGLGDLVNSISTSLMSVAEPLTTLQRQIDILWWKEAAYSEHLQESYRTAAAPLLPLAFALDLASLLPPFSPIIVEHFLEEAFSERHPSNVQKGKAGKPTLHSYIESVEIEKKLCTLVNQLPKSLPKTTGRSTLLAFVSEISQSATNRHDVLLKTGLPPTLVISQVELCLHFFREIQAQRLVEVSSDGETK